MLHPQPDARTSSGVTLIKYIECFKYIPVRISNQVEAFTVGTGTRLLFVVQNVQSRSEVHPVSFPVVTGAISRGRRGRGVKLNAHLHLAPRLGMSGARTLLSPYT